LLSEGEDGKYDQTTQLVVDLGFIGAHVAN
jgi:hypothetical protein